MADIFKIFTQSFRMTKNTVVASFRRYPAMVTSKLRRLTNPAMIVRKVPSKVREVMSQLGKKPSKREDFVETKTMFIAKSVLIGWVIAAVSFGVFIYTIGYPWVISKFFTAHFEQNNKKIPDYNGKVIVYSDAKKTIPQYEGKLEEGNLEGLGKEYDKYGVMTYSGNFSQGKRSGWGEAYENGVLVYRGNFMEGVYSGEGTLFKDDERVYFGEFADGLPSGKGTTYYPTTGLVEYFGEFSEGMKTGQGESNYPSGARKYSGAFRNGEFDGSGTLYNEDGTILYEGDFVNGLYHGSGVLALKNSMKMTSEFEEGKQTGSADIRRNGYLCYSGGMNGNLKIDGSGVLYNKLGQTVYSGIMIGGTLDGTELLGKTKDEVLTLMEGTSQRTQEDERGFTMTFRELGMKVYFAYDTEKKEAFAYDVCLYRSAVADESLSLLLWSFADNIDEWMKTARGEDGEDTVTTTVTTGNDVPRYAASEFGTQSYNYVLCSGEDDVCTIWMNPSCFMIQWTTSHDIVAPVKSAAELANSEGDEGEEAAQQEAPAQESSNSSNGNGGTELPAAV